MLIDRHVHLHNESLEFDNEAWENIAWRTAAELFRIDTSALAQGDHP